VTALVMLGVAVGLLGALLTLLGASDLEVDYGKKQNLSRTWSRH
jgi:hypothetical protein